MKVDLEEARRIAELAHLEFDDAGLARMAAEMTRILEYVDQLQDIDVQLAPSEVVRGLDLRDDVSHPSLEREDIAANAPFWNEGLFVVPQVIGDE